MPCPTFTHAFIFPTGRIANYGNLPQYSPLCILDLLCTMELSNLVGIDDRNVLFCCKRYYTHYKDNKSMLAISKWHFLSIGNWVVGQSLKPIAPWTDRRACERLLFSSYIVLPVSHKQVHRQQESVNSKNMYRFWRFSYSVLAWSSDCFFSDIPK